MYLLPLSLVSSFSINNKVNLSFTQQVLSSLIFNESALMQFSTLFLLVPLVSAGPFVITTPASSWQGGVAQNISWTGGSSANAAISLRWGIWDDARKLSIGSAGGSAGAFSYTPDQNLATQAYSIELCDSSVTITAANYDTYCNQSGAFNIQTSTAVGASNAITGTADSTGAKSSAKMVTHSAVVLAGVLISSFLLL